MHYKNFFAVSSIFLIAVVACLPVAVRADSPTASSELALANSELIACYNAAKATEAAGANITALTSTLNVAGALFSKAQFAYSSGDFSTAQNFAILCQNQLGGFVSTASSLQNAASQTENNAFLVNFVGSIFGTVAVIVCSAGLWIFLKRRHSKGIDENQRIQYKALFLVVTAVLALLVASPALQRVLVYPRADFFTEVWLLSSNHNAESFPYNLTANQNNSIYLGLGNQLGSCAYYVVEVKFRNSTQSAPDSLNRTNSNLPSLYNVTVFVADQENYELPITFCFDYSFSNVNRIVYRNVTVPAGPGGNSTIQTRAESVVLPQANFFNLRVNGVTINLRGVSSDWDSQRSRFFGNLFFEVWLCDVASGTLGYHERFVDLKFNMTSSGIAPASNFS
jgi:hypothetical protein